MSDKVEFVRELDDYGANRGGSACLVRKGGEFFVVSTVDTMFSGPETLVFPSDESGEVTGWLEVAGGRRYSRDEAIDELAGGGYGA